MYGWGCNCRGVIFFLLQIEGATDRARVRYKRGGEERKGGRERPNKQLGRINGWKGTIGGGGGCRVWRGATDTMGGRDIMALKSLGASWMLVRSHMELLCDFAGATSHDFIYL